MFYNNVQELKTMSREELRDYLTQSVPRLISGYSFAGWSLRDEDL